MARCIGLILRALLVLFIGAAVEAAAAAEAPGFNNRILPLLGKMGCSGRACHGSFQGQGGFRLSLFGSDPPRDYEALVHGSDGPRVNLRDPDASLALLKATQQVDHGGGRRFAAQSWQYDLFRAWVAAGAPYDTSAARVQRLEVLPAQVVLERPGVSHALRVVAQYSDGFQEDVTTLTQFSARDDVVASVDEAGRVTAHHAGDTAVVAQFAGLVGSTQVLVPLDEPQRRSFAFPAHNNIDELVSAKWRLLGYEPSELSGDAEFLRRVSLDLIGTLPTADEAQKFLADRDPQKRAKKIDTLLQRPEYAVFWATKFSDWTGNDTNVTPPPAAKTSWLWHDWLRQKLADNVPYDELAAGFITATTREGRPVSDSVAEYRRVAADVMPPWSAIRSSLRGDWDGKDGFGSETYARRKSNDLFWRAYDDPEKAALRLSYAFLGLRLECAQCHKHPFDRWTQDDFRGFVAFFANVRRGVPADVPADAVIAPGQDERMRELVYRYEEIYVGPSRKGGFKGKGVVDPNAKMASHPRLLGGPEPSLSEGDDPRARVMDWMREPDNPFFAPALVNRLWAHYFGVGLFEPTDELSAGNPPSNPELLQWLSRDFIDRGFDLQALHRTITNSRVYQLTWRPGANNALDERNYTHARLRRLPAEVLLDAINQVTGSREEALSFNAKTYSATIAPAGTRAIALAPTRLGQGRSRYTLEIFGRPTRSERCDAERSSDVTLSQALYLLYDDDIAAKIGAPGGRLAGLLKSTPDNRRVLRELYWAALSRQPTPAEMNTALAYVSRAGSRQAGFEDVLWAIINLREFMFNH